MSYRWWLLIAILLFGAGLLLGLATPESFLGLLSEDVAALEEMAGFLESLPQPYIFLIIFVKNVSALLVSLAFSPLLCIVPTIALIVNGWLLGLVSTSVIQEESLGYLLAGILPHGILELPAFIMGEAAILSIGMTAILALVGRQDLNQLLPRLKQNLRYLVIAVVLLIPAAVIETFVTPLFLG